MRTLLLTALLLSTAPRALAQSAPYLNPALPVEDRVEDLLGRMTLPEKVGQLTQIDVLRLMGQDEWDRGPLNPTWMEKILADQHVGSLLSSGGAAPVPNTPETWVQVTNDLQRYAIEHSRLKIPILYGIDAVHGHNSVLNATMFPPQPGVGRDLRPGAHPAHRGSDCPRPARHGHHLEFRSGRRYGP